MSNPHLSLEISPKICLPLDLDSVIRCRKAAFCFNFGTVCSDFVLLMSIWHAILVVPIDFTMKIRILGGIVCFIFKFSLFGLDVNGTKYLLT